MQYQAVIQLAQGAPQIYNLPVLHRQMIEVLGIKNADKLVPVDEDQTPRDPISENMSFLTGKPTKAFIYQDHDAHIAVHTSMMQDPAVMGQIGQNPMAQQMQAAIMAHVAEHVAFQYRTKIEQRLGATLPKPNTQMSEETEVQLSKLVAQAATQLLQIDKNEAAQKQAQQQMQDPVVQMQQQELQIKQAEQQRKQQKDQTDAQLKQQQMQIEQQRIATQAQLETAKTQAQIQATQEQDKMKNDGRNDQTPIGNRQQKRTTKQKTSTQSYTTKKAS